MKIALIQGHPDAEWEEGTPGAAIREAQPGFAIGVSPVRSSLIGTVEAEGSRELWLAKVQALGRKAI